MISARRSPSSSTGRSRLLEGMADAVVGHIFEGQLCQMVLRDELIKTVRRDDRHGWDIDIKVRKGADVDLPLPAGL